MSRRRLGTLLLGLGIAVALAPVIFSILTNLWGVREQEVAQEQWRIQRPVRPPRGPERVEPPFLLEIPKIRLRWLIREGADPEALRRWGAGHIPGTALPGEAGVVGIAGHRTTYGAPFFWLHRLGPGDPVIVRGTTLSFLYRVVRSEQVEPHQVEILRPKDRERWLVLVTCTPPYSARYRLAVFARIVDPAASAQRPSWR